MTTPQPASCSSLTRNRLRLVSIAMATVATGLLSRRYPIAGNYPGDALWATLVFALWVLLVPKYSLRIHLALAASTSFCVEFAQLYQAPWINSLRQTLPGKLILGSGFDPYDLIAYTIGCLVGLVLVHKMAPRSNEQSSYRNGSFPS